MGRHLRANAFASYIPCFNFSISASLSSNFNSLTLSISPSMSPIPTRPKKREKLTTVYAALHYTKYMHTDNTPVRQQVRYSYYTLQVRKQPQEVKWQSRDSSPGFYSQFHANSITWYKKFYYHSPRYYHNYIFLYGALKLFQRTFRLIAHSTTLTRRSRKPLSLLFTGEEDKS